MGDHEISKHLYRAAPACGSALLAALLLARGRTGRVLVGNRIIGALLLHPISDVIGDHDRDHDQQDPDQDAGLLVVGVEQKLHDIIHRVFFLSGPAGRQRAFYSQMLPFSSGFMGTAMMKSTMVIAAEKPLQKVARYSRPSTGRLA